MADRIYNHIIKLIDKKIHFEHVIDRVYDQTRSNKIIILDILPENALRAYLKFNPALSTLSPKLFINHIRWQKQINANFKLNEVDVRLIFKAEDLYNEIATRYPDRDIEIEVSEDGENGAVIKFERFKPQLISV